MRIPSRKKIQSLRPSPVSSPQLKPLGSGDEEIDFELGLFWEEALLMSRPCAGMTRIRF